MIASESIYKSKNAILFCSIIGGKNFITPNIMRYGLKGKYAYELSYGKGFDHNIIYGVTVANIETQEHEYYLCESFHSLEEAEEYIATLADTNNKNNNKNKEVDNA